MESSAIDALAYVAIALALVAYVPAIWQLIRTKDSANVNAANVALRIVGMVLWLSWAIVTRITPTIVSASLHMVLLVTWLSLIYAYAPAPTTTSPLGGYKRLMRRGVAVQDWKLQAILP